MLNEPRELYLSAKRAVRRLLPAFGLAPYYYETLKTPHGNAQLLVPPPARVPSFYVFGVSKGGSTLLFSMIREALRSAAVPAVSPVEAAWGAGLPPNGITNPEEFIFPNGYCYLGFRELPPWLLKIDLDKKKKILLVRDPRDVMVSEYYSMKHSHPLPDQGVLRDQYVQMRAEAHALDIDEYCLAHLDVNLSEFSSYEPILTKDDLRVYRYEDVVFEKLRWLTEMLEYLNIKIPPESVASIVRANDVFPEAENPTQHIRQVVPGNFRKHLRADTIRALNARFYDVMNRHGYEQ